MSWILSAFKLEVALQLFDFQQTSLYFIHELKNCFYPLG